VGRGFGHGVGLCQEGAMNMANKGFKYDEIMLFYYTDVHLTHRSVIDFFRDN
jgi:stage II sporulation protein D